MKITSLDLNCFRNYLNQSVEFSDGLNVIYGKNAQGKTNLLESIYLLSTGSSPRVSQDKEMIMFNKPQARVYGKIDTVVGSISLEMILSTKEKKRASVNDLSITKIGELLSNLNAVYFSPDEMKLIKSAPENRRKFMDVCLSQLSRSYFYVLTKYNKILKQRNALLKQSEKDKIAQTLPIWDSQLASYGAKVVWQRMAFLNKLSSCASKINSDLTSNSEQLEISYQTFDNLKISTIEEIEQSLLLGLASSLEKDLNLKFTTVGPQRDDIKIMLGDLDLRTFGSQGQQRTATLAMKLGEVEVFEEIKGDKPVLLLDDVLSELDSARQEQLIFKTRKLQTILTTTSLDGIGKIDNVITVDNGKIL